MQEQGLDLQVSVCNYEVCSGFRIKHSFASCSQEPAWYYRRLPASHTGQTAVSLISVCVSCFISQIYNESLYDLLRPEPAPIAGRPALRLKEDAQGRVFVDGVQLVRKALWNLLVAATPWRVRLLADACGWTRPGTYRSTTCWHASMLL